MMNNTLQREQASFKKKNWKPAVFLTYTTKFLLSAVSLIYIASKLQDDIRDFRDYMETESKKNTGTKPK